jgi:cysteinyl-tRNA synthetase
LVEIQREFLLRLGNDLHLPEALAFAWNIARDQNIAPREKLAAFSYFDQIFGLELDAETNVTLSERQMSLISQREEARQSKDWQTADRLRAELANEGVYLRDGPAGPEWDRHPRRSQPHRMTHWSEG